MPHFNKEGNETYICQVCGRVLDSVKHPSVWRPDITGHESAGNVCPACLKNFEEEERELRPTSLAEHCRQESGLTGAALTRYINRYYGHG